MSLLRKVIHEDVHPKIIVLTGGLLAGCAEIITTYPLDTIKTNLQIYPNKYKNLFDCGKTIIRNNGFRPLFNGMTASLIQVGGKAGIRFTIYDYIKTKLNTNKNSNLNNLISGMIAGSIESILWTAPTERIKILQQKNPNKIISTTSVIKTLVQKIGIIGLYQGTLPTILKQSSSVGVRFWLYAYLKDSLHKENANISITKTLIIGSISGSLSAAINQPLDVIKSMIQSNENKKIGIVDTTKTIIKNHGIIGLFSGLNARILRVGIAQAVTFAVYETYVSYMNKYFLTNN